MSKKNGYEGDLSKAIREIDKGQLSNIIFDGKGEIELNRRFCYRLNEIGVFARVEQHFEPRTSGRVRSDIVIFDGHGERKSVIECKACITPDVYPNIKNGNTNHLFHDLCKDVMKYGSQKQIPIFAVMWASHWVKFDCDEILSSRQIKYFPNHRSMHIRRFKIGDIKKTIRRSFKDSGLGEPFCQVVSDDPSCWMRCKAQVIATVSRAR